MINQLRQLFAPPLCFTKINILLLHNLLISQQSNVVRVARGRDFIATAERGVNEHVPICPSGRILCRANDNVRIPLRVTCGFVIQFISNAPNNSFVAYDLYRRPDFDDTISFSL